MAYRNGTYIAFDGQGTTDPTKSDMKYYGLLQRWNSSKRYELNFSDSHKKTYQVMDSSSKKTLENRLMERMKYFANEVAQATDETNYNRGMLNFEIGKAVDYYKIPIIVAYTGYDYILNASQLSSRWPKALEERIKNKTVCAIHVAFKEKSIMEAINQFSVNSTGDNVLDGPLYTYSESAYEKWGYK